MLARIKSGKGFAVENHSVRFGNENGIFGNGLGNGFFEFGNETAKTACEMALVKDSRGITWRMALVKG